VPVNWSTPFALGSALRDDVPAAVAASENGEAMVVWFGTSPAGGRVLQSRRYARVQSLWPSWQPTAAAAVIRGTDPRGASVSMDANGNALAVWETGDGRIEAARFNRAANGSGQWTAPIRLSSAGTIASTPVISLRSDGRKGLALWQTVENNRRALQWASFDASNGMWSATNTALATDADEELAPALGFTATGYALLAFQYITSIDTATRRVRVFGQWFDPSVNVWSKAVQLSDANGTKTPWATPLVPAPRVTLDGDGQGLAAWRYRDPDGECEQVRAVNFDGASRAWSSVTQLVSGCIDPLKGSSLQSTSNVLGATLAPLNARTTFLLWARDTTTGGTPQVALRANATAPWTPPSQPPVPAVDPSIGVGDAALAGSADPSALWVQKRNANPNSGFGLYASNYSPTVTACTPRWSAWQKISDVSRLMPLLRTPDRAAIPIAVWIDRVNDVPQVFVTIRSRSTAFNGG
jgi:hypothetical protein